MTSPSPSERQAPDPAAADTVPVAALGKSPPPASAAMPQVAGFELLKNLGKGAMGEVYRARDLDSGVEVALKLIAPHLFDRADLRQRFEREAKLLTRLRHPNIAGAVSHSLDAARPYIAMEFVKGPTLASLMRAVGRFQEIDVLRIGRQVALALGYAWDEIGLVHRDIKPANLLVIPEADGDGETVKIIDFGLARTEESTDMGMTQPGMVMGTPHYMAPEQIRGDEKIGPQADMYALGCTLYHLLTGSLPYEATSAVEIFSRHLTERIPDPGTTITNLASPTRHLLMTLMGKRADQRYRNHQEVVGACDAALRNLELRDTSAIRLLRRPMVLSQPRAGGPGNLDASVDPFSFETARLRRSTKNTQAPDAQRGSDYQPQPDQAPPTSTIDQPPTTTRRGKATEALVKATTESIKRKKSTNVYRREGSSTHRRVRELQASPSSHLLADPVTRERLWVPWLMVGLTLLLLVAVMVRALLS